MAAPHKHFIILWGGGLGDALVLRPLLLALNQQGLVPVLASVATHVSGVIESMGIPAQTVVLDRNPWRALRKLRSFKTIERIYIAPHSPWKTKLLAALAAPFRTFISKAPESEYLAESIKNDVESLFPQKIDSKSLISAYGPAPLFKQREVESATFPSKTYIVLHVTSRPDWPTKRWPIEQWRKLIERILNQYPFHLTIVGQASETTEISALIESLSSARVSMHCNLPLSQVESLIQSAALVICHNSGIMHIACALKIPTVAVTGSNPQYWQAPYPWIKNASSGACTLACNQRTCPVPSYQAKCITALTADMVFQHVETLLAN